MTIKEVNTGKARLLFVLPDTGQHNFWVHNKEHIPVMLMFNDDSPFGTGFLSIPEGNWSDPVRLEEVTEEMAKQILPSKPFYPDYFTGETTEILFPDFEDYACYKAIYALESFQSLLKANEIYTVNPLGLDPCTYDRNCAESCQGSCWPKDVDFGEWQAAEENTGNWILLIDKK